MGDIYDEAARLRQELRLAEEGLANYAQEVQWLHKKMVEDMYTIQSQGNEIERLRTQLPGSTSDNPEK